MKTDAETSSLPSQQQAQQDQQKETKEDDSAPLLNQEEIVYISICNNNNKQQQQRQQQQLDKIPFYHGRHVSYIRQLVQTLDQPTSYEGAVTEHLRMSGVYWSWMALGLLTGAGVADRENDSGSGVYYNDVPFPPLPPFSHDSLVDWVMACYDPLTGGFGGNVGQEAHILYTLSAIQILALANRLDDPRLNVDAVTKFCISLQQGDGSFCGDHVQHVAGIVGASSFDDDYIHAQHLFGGEVDTRFTYCALSTLALLHPNQPLDQLVQLRKAAEYIVQCQNPDGGFGCVVGAEAHAGQVFCCIGALSIAQSLDLLLLHNSSSSSTTSLDRLAWWLSERQVDSGGLNGRSEKQADVCYSWWILSALSILGRVSWINGDKLAYFILQCQDEQDGGIADRPEDMPDVFHTFFGIAGLSLLGHLHQLDATSNNSNNDDHSCPASLLSRTYLKIDPVFALPTHVVKRMGLSAQVVAPPGNDVVDERLRHYHVLQSTT